jgi:hypothetical protein
VADQPEIRAVINARERAARAASAATMILRAKLTPCVDCGLVDPEIVQFDHVPERGPKLAMIAVLAGGRNSLGALTRELAKCDIVCPNCHVRRSVRRGQFAGV